MKCPYCLSEVDEQAVVCRTCTKDLYLFKPLMQKIADLEEKLSHVQNSEALQNRILELEGYVHDLQTQAESQEETEAHKFVLWFRTLCLPLIILLIAHGLITVVYDINLLYLRVVSIVVPLPFAYWLFQQRQRAVVPWFLGAVLLASCAVVGMSTITFWVDHSPILPQSRIEWKEFIEYSASISFSFLTGMLLGTFAYLKRIRSQRQVAINPWVKALVNGLGDGKLSPDALHGLMRKVNEFGGTAVALGTTALSIYTGLKGVLG